MDAAELTHLLQYPILAFADIAAGCVCFHAMWIGQNCSQYSGIFGRQPSRRFVKIALSSSFDSVYTVAEFNDVQVSFQDAAFVPERLQKHGEISFQGFAKPVPIRPQKQILDGLLRQGAGTAQSIAIFVIVDRALDGSPVETMMLKEVLIFRRNHRKC